MALPQAFTCQPDNNSTANFRAWASAISTALQAGGNLVKTSDTGQINLATDVCADDDARIDPSCYWSALAAGDTEVMAGLIT